jgi:hypothetical protein
VNRRHFLGQVAFGSAAVALASPARVSALSAGNGLAVNFVGMMFYVRRSDGSLLVCVPGSHPLGHHQHVPFLMARTGTPIASALGLTPMAGVVPGAFDNRLADAPSGGFVFRCLEGVDVDIVAHDGGPGVDHRATYLAQMHRIAPGKRLRHDVRRWSPATVTVRGGRLDNAAAHPDAGKVWTFGEYQQRLTDATLYGANAGTVRLNTGARVDAFVADGSEPAELWVVSSAGPRVDTPDPKRLEHSVMMFEFLAGATPIIPTCAEAEGRITLASELPCSSTQIASARGGFTAAAPPYAELCYGGGDCCL